MFGKKRMVESVLSSAIKRMMDECDNQITLAELEKRDIEEDQIILAEFESNIEK